MKRKKILAIMVLGMMAWLTATGQAVPIGTAFTYQGHLYDANYAANGLYDFQFRLYDGGSGGNQIGTDVNVLDVDAIDAYFTVELDFGSTFDGNAVWLEIGVRPGDLNDPCEYTVLSPRQEITPAPYALYAAYSGIGGSGGDSLWQMNGADIYYNDGNVGIGVTDPSEKLDVDGNINASSAYNIDGETVLSVTDYANTVVGVRAGPTNTGHRNSAMGYEALYSNTTGAQNSIVGYQALFTNTTGNYNSALGCDALYSNTTGYQNSAVGRQALYANTEGSVNSAIGHQALYNNTTGYNNSAVGTSALYQNTIGIYNTAIGASAGRNSTGSGNVFLGYRAGYDETGSNKLYIANSSGIPLIYGDFSTGRVGIGTTNPTLKLQVSQGANLNTLVNGGWLELSNSGGAGFDWKNSDTEDYDYRFREVPDGSYLSMGPGAGSLFLSSNSNVGIGTTNPAAKLEVNGGDIRIGSADKGLVFYGGGEKIVGTSGWGIDFQTQSGTSRMTILNNGNVGIGTTNPQSKLSVGGDGSVGIGVYSSVDNSTGIGVYASGHYGIYGKGSDDGYSVYGDGGEIGVLGAGSDVGVSGNCSDDSGTNYGVQAYAASTGSNDAYGVHSRVVRNGSGDYWSGYFYDLGSGGAYHGLYADVRTGGAIDLAEYILDTKGDTEAGDVLAADPHNDESVIKTSKPYDSTVVGIASTKPHLLMGMELVMDEETGEMYEDVSATKLALAGRVPVKVTDENGHIERGDLLTTSSKPGYAMKWTLLDVNKAEDFDELKSILAENERRRNAVVGKALGNLDSGNGKIMALVNLQ